MSTNLKAGQEKSCNTSLKPTKNQNGQKTKTESKKKKTRPSIEELCWSETSEDKQKDSIQNLKVKAKAKIKSRVLASRENSNKFIEYCFQDSKTGEYVTQQFFHSEFQEAVMDESRTDEIVLWPRDHGKTTQLEGATIWLLGNNPNLRIKIVSESDNRAVERLFSINQHIRTNDRVKAVFPHLKPAELGDWTKHKIVVERSHIMRDASIEALGILSTATGGRADVLFVDDGVGRRNSIEQPKLRETVKSAWDSDWSNLLEPWGRTFWVNTPWHVADCTHKLLKNPIYNVTRYPVGTDKDPFESIWPEKWPREALQRRKKKIGELEFNRGFRLIALSGEYATVHEDWIDYWTEAPDPNELQIFEAFDVSSGEASDYFACVVIGVDPVKMFLYVLDAWHAKLTFLGRAGAVERENQRWMPDMLGIEDGVMRSLRQYLEETTLINVVPLRPTLSKEIRLMGITPYLERGQVLFNPILRPQVIINREEHGDLVTELTQFPLAPNDDLVDAFVHCMALATTYGGVEEVDGIGINVCVVGGNGGDGDLFDVDETGIGTI